jgi:predicted phage terminase large subunit-like protein
MVVLSIDTASTISLTSDYSVCAVWGTQGEHCCLLDVTRNRFAYPELKAHIIDRISKWQPHQILIEDANIGTALIHDLQQLGHANISRHKPTRPKIERAIAEISKLEAGLVYIPDAAPWLGEFLSEVVTFPHGRHDDQVDAMIQLLCYRDKLRARINPGAFYGLGTRRVSGYSSSEILGEMMHRYGRYG